MANLGSGKEIVRGERKGYHRTARERREMGERLLSMRNRGVKHWEACKELGISEPTGHRYIDLVLSYRIPPTVDDYRKQQNDALDETQQKIDEQFGIAATIGRQGMEVDSPVLLEKAASIRANAISLQLRLDERRARLNGLDAPVKVDATVTTHDVADVELQEMIRETQAKIREAKNGG